MLEVVVFVAGAVLMALELLGSRVLAPVFGNSILVWGSLIGMFLAAMTGGYYLGGRLADRVPRLSILVGVLGAAGVWIGALPQVTLTVLGQFADASWAGPRSGPLAAATALFFVPSLLLATASPFAIRLAARGVEGLGGTAGRLTALSSLGSLVGTFLTAFVLIPVAGVRSLLIGLGVAILAVAAVALLHQRRALDAVIAASLCAALLWQPLPKEGLYPEIAPPEPLPVRPLAPRPEPGPDGFVTLYEKDSAYHHIRVTEGGGSRYLRFDRSWQSGMLLSDPFATRFEYTDLLHLGMVLRPDARRALFIGLGGGSAPKRFWRSYPEMQVDVVEIDAEVVDVARRFFALPDDKRLAVTVQDGRQFLQATTQRYDLIVMDAYYADSVPFHLTTQEFMRLARNRLQPGGVLAINVIGALEGPRSRFFRSVARTAGSVFPTLYAAPVGWRPARDAGRVRNIILAATADGRLPQGELDRRANTIGKAAGIPTMEQYVKDLYGPVAPASEDAPLLTDDRAPVDNLLGVDGL